MLKFIISYLDIFRPPFLPAIKYFSRNGSCWFNSYASKFVHWDLTKTIFHHVITGEGKAEQFKKVFESGMMSKSMITLTCLYVQNKDNFMVWIIYCNWENTMKNIIWNLLRIICVHIWVKIVECKLEYLGWHVSYQELKIMAHWFQSQMRWKDSGFNLMNTWSKIAQNIIFKGQIIYKSILR